MRPLITVTKEKFWDNQGSVLPAAPRSSQETIILIKAVFMMGCLRTILRSMSVCPLVFIRGTYLLDAIACSVYLKAVRQERGILISRIKLHR